MKLLAGNVSLWHSVDRSVLVEEVAKRDPGADILIQVNTTDEVQKSGCAPSEVRQLVGEAADLNLNVLGLMTIGPTDGSDPQPNFNQLRELGDANGLKHLSMGMSGDYEIAVRSGATIIRLGSVLFGPRKPPSVKS